MPVNNIPRHTHNGTDSNKIKFGDLENVGEALLTIENSAPLGSITAPSGGLTVDSEARTAINALISRMETLGLIEEN